MFDPVPRLLLGLLTGIVFGFLLQKGRVAKYHVILGQLLLRDWTAAKIMATAVVVGAVGIFPIVYFSPATFHIKPLAFGPVVAGALLFGIGLALFGYCPGTGVAACGEGRRDAMAGVAGMLCGALAYVATYSAVRSALKGFGDWGKTTLPDLTGLGPVLWIGALAAAVALSWIRARRRAAHAGAAPPRPA